MGETIQGEKTVRHTEKIDGLAASRGRQPAEHNSKNHDQHKSHPESGQAETEDGPAHNTAADPALGFDTGDHAQRDAQ